MLLLFTQETKEPLTEYILDIVPVILVHYSYILYSIVTKTT